MLRKKKETLQALETKSSKEKFEKKLCTTTKQQFTSAREAPVFQEDEKNEEVSKVHLWKAVYAFLIVASLL